MEVDRTERRILGSLIEKRWTTPEVYPLTINALVAAVRQKSNRDPIMELHDFEVEGALLALREKGLVLIREREGGRTTRYAERMMEEMALSRQAAALLAELMLRGPQASGEVSRRASRMAPDIETPEKVEAVFRELAERRLVRLLPRGPRERYPRWAHLLAPESEVAEVPEVAESTPTAPSPSPSPMPRSDLAELQARVAELEQRVRALELERGMNHAEHEEPEEHEG